MPEKVKKMQTANNADKISVLVYYWCHEIVKSKVLCIPEVRIHPV